MADQYEAGADGLSIHEHGACSTFAFRAVFLRACDLQLFPKNFKESVCRRGSNRNRFAIEFEIDEVLDPSQSYAPVPLDFMMTLRNLEGVRAARS